MSPEEATTAHRYFAVECNNRAWDLVVQAKRTAAEDRKMLLAAHAAAFHWSKAGRPVNDMRAELLLARVHSLLGHGAEALRYAQRCLEFCADNACEDWDLAFAHAETALAARASGDDMLYRRHYALAQAQGQAIKDPEDRETFLTEFARVPKPE